MERQLSSMWENGLTALRLLCAKMNAGMWSKVAILLCLFVPGLSAMAQTTAYSVGQASNTGNGSGKTLSMTVSTSAATGDLLLAQVAVAALTCTNATTPSGVTAPAGWTAISCLASTGGGSNIMQAIYSKTATATDAGTAYSWTWTSANEPFAGTMLAYRNALGVDIAGGQANSTSSGTATTASVTTTVANDVVVAFFASAYGTTITPASALNAESGPALSSTGNGGAGAVAADFFQATAGATGQQTASLGNNARSAGALVAIKPVTATQACNAPSNVVATLAAGSYTCYCDNFNRVSLSPSPIFNSTWLANFSNGTYGAPRIVAPGRLRMTDNSGDAADSATVPGIFPAAGNYISVEFNHYAYNGSGADGLAVTLSDSSVPANPGGFGGSQGYAPEGTAGFAGGWLGVALDEFGNYSNPTEGRTGGPGFIAEQIGMRGPGSGTNGYVWISGSGASPGGLSIDNHTSIAPNNGYMYQVIVDARNETSGTVNVGVNRDSTTKNGSSYGSVVAPVNVYSAATNALAQGWTTQIVPNNWLISFTSSTGGSTNIHEIGSLRVCASTILPPNSGNSSSNFNAIDSAYTEPVSVITAQQGHIYTKLAGAAFPLDVIAFASATAINTAYVNPVTVQLIDDSGNLGSGAPSNTGSCNASAVACSGCTKPVIATQAVTFAAANAGQVKTANFTVPNAYSRVIARICQGATCTGSPTISCSSDAFTVRPSIFSTVTSTATNSSLTTGATSLPVFKAGTSPFTMTVATATPNYTGTPNINPAGMSADGSNWTIGTFAPSIFPAAVASTATSSFTYGDVGNFTFLGYDPTAYTTPANILSPRGIYDSTWTTGSPNATLLGSNDVLNGDCNANTSATSDPKSGAYSNVIDSSGKYGCYFGIAANTATFGRFVPDHFTLTGSITPAVTGGSPNFTYMGDPALYLKYTLTACAGATPGCSTTVNYSTAISPVYPVTPPVLVAEDQATVNLGFDLGPRISLGTTNPATPAWTAGVYTVDYPSAAGSPKATFILPITQPGGLPASKPASILNAGGPFDSLSIGVNMSDADGGVIYPNDMNANVAGTCSGSGCNAKQIGSTSVREGRLTLSNAYGSELLTLPVNVAAQYYNSVYGNWILNTADTGGSAVGATVIPLGGAVITHAVASLNGGTLPTVKFVASQGSTTVLASSPQIALVNGAGTFYLYDSNAKQGTADIALNLGIATVTQDVSCNPVRGTATAAVAYWLQYPWCSTPVGQHDPNGRVKFGSPQSPYIYLREMY